MDQLIIILGLIVAVYRTLAIYSFIPLLVRIFNKAPLTNGYAWFIGILLYIMNNVLTTCLIDSNSVGTAYLTIFTNIFILKYTFNNNNNNNNNNNIQNNDNIVNTELFTDSFCKQCGQALNDNDNFCFKCGTKIKGD